MQFAICNETFQDWPFERAFDFARECGYTGIEIAPFTIATDVRQISNSRRGEVRRQAEQAGLEVVGLHWLLAKTSGYYLTTPDEQVRQATSHYLEDLARLCRDLGGSLMVLGSPLQRNLLPGVSHEQAMKYAAAVLQQAVPVLQECEVTLAIEPLGPAEGDFLLTADSGAELMDMVGSPNCRLHLDCKAMSSEDSLIPDLLRKHSSRMAHFHANDPNKQGPGFGELDFVPIFRTLHEIGYEGWVSVEVFDYEPGIERLARESFTNVQRDLAAARK